MNTRTLFLSALVLVSSAFPAQAFRLTISGVLTGAPSAQSPPRSGARAALRQCWHHLGLAMGLLAVAALVWYVAPASGVLMTPNGFHWLAAAAAVGCLAPAIEFGVGALAVLGRGQKVGRIGLHQLAATGSALAVVGAVGVAVAEEILFRGVGLHLLGQVLGWPIAAAVALTAVVYGLNHLYFGWVTVGQKIVTGVAFGALYELGGHSVLVPVVAHVAQNLVVLTVLPRLAARP